MNRGKDGRLHRRWAVNGNAARASRVWIRAKRVWDMVVVRADHMEMVWPREMNPRKEQLLSLDKRMILREPHAARRRV